MEPPAPAPPPPWNTDPLPARPREPLPWQQPRPRKGRLLIGLLIGLLAGLAVFGPSGYLVAVATQPESSASPDPSAPPPTGAPSPTLGPYEQSQLALNQPKFDGDLATLAEPWLPWVGGCLSSADPRGPRLEPGEQTRIFCEYGNLNVFFVRYASVADRDKVRVVRQRQTLDAATLAPGVGASTTRSGTSGKTTGAYAEFAYRAGTGADARTSCGIWWDHQDAPVGAYLETLWTEGVGERWEPLRDIWQRHS